MQNTTATAVILAEGAIDMHAAKSISATIDAMLDLGQVHIVIDWTKALAINPLAIGLLLTRQHALLGKSGELKFCQMAPAIRRVFFKFGVDALFENYATLEDAIESFDEEWSQNEGMRREV